MFEMELSWSFCCPLLEDRSTAQHVLLSILLMDQHDGLLAQLE